MSTEKPILVPCVSTAENLKKREELLVKIDKEREFSPLDPSIRVLRKDEDFKIDGEGETTHYSFTTNQQNWDSDVLHLVDFEDRFHVNLRYNTLKIEKTVLENQEQEIRSYLVTKDGTKVVLTNPKGELFLFSFPSFTLLSSIVLGDTTDILTTEIIELNPHTVLVGDYQFYGIITLIDFSHPLELKKRVIAWGRGRILSAYQLIKTPRFVLFGGGGSRARNHACLHLVDHDSEDIVFSYKRREEFIQSITSVMMMFNNVEMEIILTVAWRQNCVFMRTLDDCIIRSVVFSEPPVNDRGFGLVKYSDDLVFIFGNKGRLYSFFTDQNLVVEEAVVSNNATRFAGIRTEGEKSYLIGSGIMGDKKAKFYKFEIVVDESFKKRRELGMMRNMDDTTEREREILEVMCGEEEEKGDFHGLKCEVFDVRLLRNTHLSALKTFFLL